jgi:chaperone modulatory protein CbpM
MNLQTSESIWLNETGVCRIEHLVEVSGLSAAEIEDLIHTGVLVPTDAESETLFFELRYVVTVKAARRLRDDFQLDTNGVALALTLLQKIDALEQQLATLQARLGGRLERV